MSAAPDNDTPMLASAAKTYAEHGVHIFPVQPRGKLPIIPRCPDSIDEHGNKLAGRALARHAANCTGEGHGFHDATTDPDRVERWWSRWPDANIGIALGVNDLFALDVDGPEGAADLEALERAHGRLPPTYQVVTGRAEGGGRHHIYRQPPDRRIPNHKITSKLETRGEGGYVVAPPSIHESGRPYLAVGSWQQITDPPAWLVELVTPRRDAPSQQPASPWTPRDGHEAALRRLQGLAGKVAIAEEGKRNDTLNWAAYTAGGIVAAGRIDRATAEDVLRRAAERAGLDPGEINATIASGLDAGAASPDYDDPALTPPPVTTLPTTGEPSEADTASPPLSTSAQLALQRIQTGAEFILDTDHHLTPVWGDADGEIAWARGEPLILTGPTGVGKTTVTHQILERLLGLNSTPFLGLPVPQRARRVLYLACDRPNQIRRAFARRFHEQHRADLHERLVVHNGYLPVMVDQEPTLLAELTTALDCDVVVVDSLKDVATELEKGPPAQAVNAALQMVCQAGADVIVLHHQRKAQGDNKRPKAIDDLYGNTLIPAGAGSVILLWGAPGDMAVELHHLKKPAEDIGPLKLVHHHREGVTVVDDSDKVDLVALARRTKLTVPVAAQALYGTPLRGGSAQARNEREKARYQLQKAVDRGVLKKVEQGESTAPVYVPAVSDVTVLEVPL